MPAEKTGPGPVMVRDIPGMPGDGAESAQGQLAVVALAGEEGGAL